MKNTMRRAAKQLKSPKADAAKPYEYRRFIPDARSSSASEGRDEFWRRIWNAASVTRSAGADATAR
jgi:hypothetical protein